MGGYRVPETIASHPTSTTWPTIEGMPKPQDNAHLKLVSPLQIGRLEGRARYDNDPAVRRAAADLVSDIRHAQADPDDAA